MSIHIIVTPNAKHDTAPISEMVASIMAPISAKIKVNNSTAPMGQGNWSATTVKDSTLSETVRSLARIRSSTSVKPQTLQRSIRTGSGKQPRREASQ